MKIILIAAIANNNVIGYKGEMPWHIPDDLKRFKQITKDHIVVMGRKTFQSIGRPLPNRSNIVLTRDKGFKAEGCTVFSDFAELMAKISTSRTNIFVIGGEEIYRKFMPFAAELLITKIDYTFEGDTFFPPIRKKDWRIVNDEVVCGDQTNHFRYRFQRFIRP